MFRIGLKLEKKFSASHRSGKGIIVFIDEITASLISWRNEPHNGTESSPKTSHRSGMNVLLRANFSDRAVFENA